MSGTGGRGVEFQVGADTTNLATSMNAASAAASRAFSEMMASAQKADQQVTASTDQMVQSIKALDAVYRASSGAAQEAAATMAGALLRQVAAMNSASDASAKLAISLGQVQIAAGVTDREFQALLVSSNLLTSRLLSSALASTQAGEAMADLGSVVTTLSGGALQELIDETLVADTGFKAAAESASIFAAALGEVGTQVQTTSASGFSQMVSDLLGINNNFKSAQASADAFAEELDKVESKAAIADTMFQRLMANTGNLNARLLSATLASTNFGARIGDVTSKVQTLSGSVLREVIDNMTGVSSAMRMTSDESIALASQFGKIESAATRLRGVNTSLFREMIVAVRELMTGNLTRIPGTLLVMAERMQAFSTATMAAVGSVGLLAFGIAGVVSKMNELERAKISVEAASVGTLLPPGFATQERAVLVSLADTTTEESKKIVGDFVNMSHATKEQVDFLIRSVQPIANMIPGESVSAAAQKVADAFNNPLSQSTQNFLRQIHASQQQFDDFKNTLDISKSRTELFQIINDRVEALNKAVPDATHNMTTYGQAMDYLRRTSLGAALGLKETSVQAGMTAQQLQARRMQEYGDAAKAALQNVSGEMQDARQVSQEWTKQLNDAITLAKEASIEAVGPRATPQQLNEAEAKAAITAIDGFETAHHHTTQEEKIAEDRAYFAARNELAHQAASEGVKAEHQSLESVIASYNAQIAAARGNWSQVLQLEQDKVEAIRGFGAAGTTALQHELVTQANMQREADNADIASKQRAVAEQEKLDRDAVESKRASLNEQVVAGQITKADAVQQLVELEQQQEQTNAQTLADLIKSLDEGSAAYKKAVDARLAYMAGMEAKIKALQAQGVTDADKASEAQFRTYASAFEKIGDNWESTIGGLITHTETLVSAEKSLLKTVADSFITMAGHMLLTWIAAQAKQLGVSLTTQAAITAAQARGDSGFSALLTTQLGQWLGFQSKKQTAAIVGDQSVTSTNAAATAAQTATQVSGQAAQVGAVSLGQAGQTAATASGIAARKTMETTANSASILGSAGRAAAGAYAALAGVPIVGPALGAAAAVATFAAVAAYQSLASLDVGAWNVPQDMVARIHKNEMVVPATFASQLRGNLGGSSAFTGGHNALNYSPTIHMPSSMGSQGLSAADMGTILRASQKQLYEKMRSWTGSTGSTVLAGR